MFVIYEFNWIWIHIWNPNCMTSWSVFSEQGSINASVLRTTSCLYGVIWSPRKRNGNPCAMVDCRKGGLNRFKESNANVGFTQA